jgi:hypothetical protein
MKDTRNDNSDVKDGKQLEESKMSRKADKR